jgi:hypothetical protein
MPQHALVQICAKYVVEVTNASSGEYRNHLISNHPDKDSYAVILEYVAEGAANVIWSLGSEPSLQDKLLRLRKGTWSGDEAGPPVAGKRPPPFISSTDVLDQFLKNVRPLFEPGQVVEQELVHVEASIIARCNSRLDVLERDDHRPHERWHWHIKHEETCGLLITSMLPTSKGSVMFHVKPKWLTQSPTAPSNAKRCRTCALAAKRGTDPARNVCPLALCSGDRTLAQRQIEKLAMSHALMYPEQVIDHAQQHGQEQKRHRHIHKLEPTILVSGAILLLYLIKLCDLSILPMSNPDLVAAATHGFVLTWR